MNWIKKGVALLKDGGRYAQFLLKRPKATTSTAPALVLHFERPQIYHRYLYTLVKFFLIHGYRVYIPLQFSTFRHYHQVPYLNLLATEDQVFFQAAPPEAQALVWTDAQFSPDYFNPFYASTKTDAQWRHLPMSMHPLMYHRQLWKQPLPMCPRKQSVFMLGNFDPAVYQPLLEAFGIADRNAVYDHLAAKGMLYPCPSRDALDAFLDGAQDGQCLIMKRKDFTIPIEELRALLQQFSFFLALPGTVMPHCHNLIEALSVGTIPILHAEYARMMVPALQHGENALIYQDLDTLEQCLQEAYTLTPSSVQRLRTAAQDYYQTHLTPQAVVQLVLQNPQQKFWLMAEHQSVEQLKVGLASS